MATELIIETPDNVHRVNSYPVRIGRSADNDITIKSPFIADHHAVIEESGQGLAIRSLGESHANGTRIKSTRSLDGNTLLQIGAATLKIWTDRKKPMPYADKKRRWWPLFTHPAAVCCWFAAAVALPMWDGYLDSPQSYIFDYNRFITLLIILLGITWIVHSMILPLSRRYLILPVLGIISAYSASSDIVDSLAGWYGFQFNSTAATTCSCVVPSCATTSRWQAVSCAAPPCSPPCLSPCSSATPTCATMTSSASAPAVTLSIRTSLVVPSSSIVK